MPTSEPLRRVPRKRGARRPYVAFFGHFGRENLGNEGTLQAVLHHLRRLRPDARVLCICTGAETVASEYEVETLDLNGASSGYWAPRSSLGRGARAILLAIPTEVYRCFQGYFRLRRADMLVVPGTGLLTDAFGLRGWGPFNLLKWSLLAKASRCKLRFVSVGAGPVNSKSGRWLVRVALALADSRSYRDLSSQQYLESLEVSTRRADRIYPDLAFSLPLGLPVLPRAARNGRPVVGVGVMGRESIYGVADVDAAYDVHLEAVAGLVRWLLGRGYSVRLLVGDLGDVHAKNELWARVQAGLPDRSPLQHVINEPIGSVEDLVSQISSVDFVVATRFHNVLMALLYGKPAIAISLHDKCRALMSAMGLARYSLEPGMLEAELVIERFRELEEGAAGLRPVIRDRVEEFRAALDQQYERIFSEPAASTRV
ncbi:MAG: hypothetical protein C5B48_06520 [Candidatus Rokuibacteriota bacterium]|nr:MAG: hypothetical protein C5B48_06520 [Candidatus Rokubacteria bacterium]